MAKVFKVTLKKSLIGCTATQRETVRCLGLTKVGSQSTLKDSPATRGQILKVQHLVTLEVEG